jgi:hypothetical protein
MSDQGLDRLRRRLEEFDRSLTPTQRADNERFIAFWDAWPQSEADFDPDEWALAEQVREATDEFFDSNTPVRHWAEWIRACELFDELYGFTREPSERR